MNKTLKGIIACLALAAALLAVPCVAQAGQGKGISIRENFGNYRDILREKKYDRNRDGYLSRGEIKKIKSLDISKFYYKVNLKGLGRLKNLEKLSVEAERLRNVKEIGKLKRLKSIDISVEYKERKTIRRTL